jgi:copper oxidase (laccase) domain-containing protein
MTENGQQHGAVVTMGEAALTGWRGSVGRAIARPIAKRTRFDPEQIEAVLGLILLAYTIYRVGRPLVRAARKQR